MMEISYLREFMVLSQTGSFMEAAEVLDSSQSVLSKHIKCLESELGVPLFDRTTRSVKISKYGQMLLPYARQITDLAVKYNMAVQNGGEDGIDTLTIGSIPALAQYKIVDILVNFKKKRPQTTINAVQANSVELKEMLRQSKCELAFIRYGSETDDDLEQILYSADVMSAVLPAAHRLAHCGVVPLRELADENFLLLERSTVLYRMGVEACHLSGFEPKVAYTDHRLENLVELVIGGMGVALMMKPLALYLDNPQIAIVDITPVLTSELRLCRLKDRELSEAARLFIRCTEEQKSKNSVIISGEEKTK